MGVTALRGPPRIGGPHLTKTRRKENTLHDDQTPEGAELKVPKVRMSPTARIQTRLALNAPSVEGRCLDSPEVRAMIAQTVAELMTDLQWDPDELHPDLRDAVAQGLTAAVRDLLVGVARGPGGDRGPST